MTSPEERILDMDLDALLGGFEAEDLTERIVRITDEVRETEGKVARRPNQDQRHRLQRVSADQEPHETESQKRASVWQILPLVAAVSVTLLIGLLMREDSRPVAMVDRPVTVWRGDEELVTETLHSADCVVIGELAVTEGLGLTMSNGAQIQLYSQAMLHLEDGRHVDLLRGSLAIQAHPHPPTISAPNRVVVTPKAEATMRLDLAPWSSTTPDRLSIQSMIQQKTLIATTLAISVFSGRAEVLTAQSRQVVEATATVTLGGDAKSGKDKLSAAERTLIARSIRVLKTYKPNLQSSQEEQMLQMKYLSEASGDLTSLLQVKPQVIALIREDLKSVKLPSKPSLLHEAVLNLLVLDSDKQVTSRVLGILMKTPSVVSMRQLITLAGRNQLPAISRIEEIVSKRPDDLTLVPYAAILAMHRKTVGEAILRSYLAKVPADRVDNRTFMASIGLHALGDQEAWPAQVERVKTRVETALSKNQLRAAKFDVLRAGYYKLAVTLGKPIGLGGVTDPMQSFYGRHLEELATASDVSKALKSL